MTIFRADAIASVVLGVLLLAGSWDGLYDALDLPVPKPAFYAQLAGVMLLVFAYLLWTREPRLLARPIAVGNLVAAAVLVVWLVAGKVNSGALGKTLLALVAVGLVAFAAAELRAARE